MGTLSKKIITFNSQLYQLSQKIKFIFFLNHQICCYCKLVTAAALLMDLIISGFVGLMECIIFFCVYRFVSQRLSLYFETVYP